MIDSGSDSDNVPVKKRMRTLSSRVPRMVNRPITRYFNKVEKGIEREKEIGRKESE